MTAAPPELHVVGAALLRGALCLVGQRKQGGSFGELWEFPGGKVEVGETATEALKREIREELGVEIELLDWAGQGRFVAGGRTIVLDVYFAVIDPGEPEPETREHLALRWIGVDDISSLPWADPDLPILGALRARLVALESDPTG